MKYRIAFLALLTVIVTVSLLIPATGQQVIQPASPGTTVIQAPGSVGTTQIPFCLSTSSGGAAAATVTVPALGGKQIFVTGFEITGPGATAASAITVTAAWGGTTFATYFVTVPAGVTAATPNLITEFPVAVTAGSPGANFVLTVPSFGAGNTASAAVVHGYYQ